MPETIETLRLAGCRRWERGEIAPDVWLSECRRFRIDSSVTGAYLLVDLHEPDLRREGRLATRHFETLTEAVKYAEVL